MKAATRTRNTKFEYELRSKGIETIAGVDEVGCGCLAGPVVAAAVILRWDDFPKGVTDSKKLTAKARETLAQTIRERALHFAIGVAAVEEVDSLNIFHAAKLAMVRAVDQLQPVPQQLLIDGKFKIPHALPQLCIVKGDALSISIGAASIVAKVYRDQMMEELDGEYPGYGFAQHKGYGSVFHRQQLQEKGPTPIHRKSFSWTPV